MIIPGKNAGRQENRKLKGNIGIGTETRLGHRHVMIINVVVVL